MEWFTTSYDLDDDTSGYLLESDEGFYACDLVRGWAVPAFSTPDNARLFAREAGIASVADGVGLDLAPIARFIEGTAPLPPDALDAWGFCSEVASAARRSPLPPAADEAIEDMLARASAEVLSDGDLAVLRRALSARLDCFRLSIVQLDVAADE